LCAGSDAVDLASITPPTDKSLRAAAATQKHPARYFIRARGTKYPSFFRRPALCFRQLRQYSITPARDHLLLARILADAPPFLQRPASAARAEPVDMWTTQERCPHTHRRNDSRSRMQREIGKGSTPGSVRSRRLRHTHLTSTASRTCRRLYAGPDSRSHPP
jgi:hypothetical protein